MGNCAACLVLATSLALACVASADPAGVTQSAQTEQSLYDVGQAAFDKNDWDGAIAGFSAALARASSEGRSEAVIRERLAYALLQRGHTADAETQTRRAIADFTAKTPGPDADLVDAELTLGEALQSDFSYDAAIEAYKQAQAFAAGPDAADQLRAAALGIIRSAMVTHPDLAASTADRVLADDASFQAQPHDWQSQVLTLRARAALNSGDLQGAKRYADRALRLVGPLSSRVNLYQVEARGDAALIYSLLGDTERTRELLTYTGAGHLPAEFWRSANRSVRAPQCTTGISPDDTAIVEFAIATDGTTAGATPIYASRPGSMGVLFAQAVRAWRWDPAIAARLEPLWRAAVRVQLRCSRWRGPEPRTDGVADAQSSLPERVASNLSVAGPPSSENGSSGVDCLAVPGRPGFISGYPGGADFPNEASRWGFEGFVVEGVDIGAHGEMTDERTLIAYPPFVFADAAQRMVRHFRYRPGTLAAIQAGCNQLTVWVDYKERGR